MKKKVLEVAICIALFMVAAACQSERTVHLFVAPDGLDQNPGSLEQPFATLRKARVVFN